MPGWIGPMAALSLLVIAACVVALLAIIIAALKQVRDNSAAITSELKSLRSDLASTLDTVSRLGQEGLDIVEVVRDEAHQIVETSRHLRYDLQRGVRRARKRLADLDAVVEVVQEEVEETAVTVATALESARSGAGMVEQLRRLVFRPKKRRRGAA